MTIHVANGSPRPQPPEQQPAPGRSRVHRAFAIWDADRPPFSVRVWGPAVLALLALHGLLIATPARPLPDSLGYIELGRGLARGEGYHLFGVRDHLWPPGLALMLAGIFAVARDGLMPVRAMLTGWLLLGGWLTYRVGRPLLGPRLAALVAWATLLNPAVVRLQRSILSEPPFGALVLASLACWCAWQRGRPAKASWWWVGLGALAAAGAAVVRTIGVVVGPALAAAQIFGDRGPGVGGRGIPRCNPRPGARRPIAGTVAVAALFVAGSAGGLALGPVITGGGGKGLVGYLELASRRSLYDAAGERVTAGEFALRTLEAGGRWWLHCGAAMLGDKNPETGAITGPLLLLAAVAGLFGRRRAALAAFSWLLILYGAGIAATAFEGGVRFAVPLLGVSWVLLLSVLSEDGSGSGGGGRGFVRLRRLVRRAAVVVLVATPVVGAGAVVYYGVSWRCCGGPAERVSRGFELGPGDLEEIALLDRWVPAAAPTLSDNALLLRRVTGRPLFPTMAVTDRQAYAAHLDRWGIRYAVIKKKWMRGDRPTFATRPWIKIDEREHVVVLRRPAT